MVLGRTRNRAKRLGTPGAQHTCGRTAEQATQSSEQRDFHCTGGKDSLGGGHTSSGEPLARVLQMAVCYHFEV